MPSKRLTVEQKQQIFHDLVTTQDVIASVRKSYELVTEKYGITEAQLRQIEDEGLEKQWPPLEDEPVRTAV